MYASYDEKTYCMPVMMRGPIVCLLCVGRNRVTNKQIFDEFHRVLKGHNVFLVLPVYNISEVPTLVKYSSHA